MVGWEKHTGEIKIHVWEGGTGQITGKRGEKNIMKETNEERNWSGGERKNSWEYKKDKDLAKQTAMKDAVTKGLGLHQLKAEILLLT